ncbi:hypothetical protein D3C72_2100000 [compost metagenome]
MLLFIADRQVHCADATLVQESLQRIGKGKHRLAQRIVHHGNRSQQHRRAHAGTQRLAQRFLGGEALGEKARRLFRLRQFGPLGFGQQTLAATQAVTCQQRVEALDARHVGADAVNHYSP